MVFRNSGIKNKDTPLENYSNAYLQNQLHRANENTKGLFDRGQHKPLVKGKKLNEPTTAEEFYQKRALLNTPGKAKGLIFVGSEFKHLELSSKRAKQKYGNGPYTKGENLSIR